MCIRRNRRGLGVFVGLIAVMLAALPAVVRAGQTDEEQLMPSIPAGSSDPFVSKDGRFIAVVEPAPNNQVVMVSNGQPGDPYDQIWAPVMQTSGQNDRMVYEAELNGNRFYVDGGQTGAAHADVGPAYISPDTQQIFYAAKDNGQWCPFADGLLGAPCDEVGIPTFSPDGKHLTYSIRNGKVWNVIADGAMEPAACDEVDAVVYSPDSKRMCYDSVQNGQHVITLDHRPGPAFDAILPGTPFFTTDNLRCVYFGQTNGKWDLVINNAVRQVGGPYDAVTVPLFKSNNQHFMFIATVPMPPANPPAANQPPAAPQMGQALVYDGAIGTIYDSIAPESLHFQPDVNNVNGPQYIYEAVQNGNPITVLDRFPGPSFGTIVASTVNFTPDGSQYYYWAKDQGQWLWRNLRHTVGNYDDYKVGPTPFAADSKRTMYAVKTPNTNGQWQVIIDGNPLPNMYDDIDESTMIFSPNAQHTIFVAKSKGAWKVVIDGVEGPDYTQIVKGGEPIVQPDGSIIYYGIKANGSLNRVGYKF